MLEKHVLLFHCALAGAQKGKRFEQKELMLVLTGESRKSDVKLLPNCRLVIAV